jgi:hypothetical protein
MIKELGSIQSRILEVINSCKVRSTSEEHRSRRLRGVHCDDSVFVSQPRFSNSFLSHSYIYDDHSDFCNYYSSFYSRFHFIKLTADVLYLSRYDSLANHTELGQSRNRLEVAGDTTVSQSFDRSIPRGNTEL